MEAIRTIIVDDEARIRRGIGRLLSTCEGNWEVVAVLSSGLEALEYMDQSHGDIDLLITDIRMPDMDGLTLVKEAKRRYTFYPVMISGYNDFEYMQTAIREGAVDYIMKPVDREQFRRRMKEISAIILQNKRNRLHLHKMERELKLTRQTQMLSYVTSAGLDMGRLGYWVEDFPKGLYVLLYISLDPVPVKSRSYTSKDWEAFDYAMENIIIEVADRMQEQYEGRMEKWCWKGGDSDYWVMLHSNGNPEATEIEQSASDLSASIRTAIALHTPFSVSVSYGNRMEDLYMLPEARQRSLSLMNYRLLYGSNRTFHDDMADWAVERMDSELAHFAHRLRAVAEQANTEEAAALSQQFFQRLSQISSPMTIQYAVQNAYIQIHSVGIEYVSGDTVPVSLEKGIQSLSRAAHLHVLKKELDTLILDVISLVRDSRQSGSLKPVEQAKAWIIAHLGSDLSIKSIADRVYMNPSYFSRTFKMQTGVTVLDYITNLRMERAKELLTDAKHKVSDVCSLVGYQDVKYFSRQFKQRYGETPSKYRERLEGAD